MAYKDPSFVLLIPALGCTTPAPSDTIGLMVIVVSGTRDENGVFEPEVPKTPEAIRLFKGVDFFDLHQFLQLIPHLGLRGGPTYIHSKPILLPALRLSEMCRELIDELADVEVTEGEGDSLYSAPEIRRVPSASPAELSEWCERIIAVCNWNPDGWINING